MNPSRGKNLDFTPPRVTVAVLVYAPHQAGYFQHRLDVTRLTLESILANTEKPYELLVFDNGSCPEMTGFLQALYNTGKIDTLILSAENIGKLNALWRIAQAAQGEVIAYTDDDVYHLPGWLPEHLKVLDTYPNVGAVTGFYIKQRVAMSSDQTLAWVKALEEKDPSAVQRGNLIPRKWEEEFMDNAGRTEERYQGEIEGIEDVVVSLQGVKAWVSAHHFEVLVPKNVLIEVLNQMLPGGWSDQLMGRMVEMDDRMDALGYLRLTTYPQTMRLLGNVIDDEVSELARRDGIIAASATSNAKPGKRAGLWQNRFVRASIQKLINKLYQLLHQDGRSS
ncbi:MAG: glycosyltransferase family A protein [Anaerolineaceae bacterium]|nr:glycosyltransferase family A protein [Anaerolineaceae bacterium]HPT23898.1 glycosyltransferase family A protein [Anaerolineaceae bacterium]